MVQKIGPNYEQNLFNRLIRNTEYMGKSDF